MEEFEQYENEIEKVTKPLNETTQILEKTIDDDDSEFYSMRGVRNITLGQLTKTIEGDKVPYEHPYWLSDFKVIDRIKTKDDLLKCDSHTIILDDNQRKTLDMLGLNNVKRFERETGFLFHNSLTFNNFSQAFQTYYRLFEKKELELERPNYSEFLSIFARFLSHSNFNDIAASIKEDLVGWNFSDIYPRKFIDANAPYMLRTHFYNGEIEPGNLASHKEYIPYLLDKDLTGVIKANIRLNIPGPIDEKGQLHLISTNFIDEYIKRHGNEKLLQLITKYSYYLDDLEVISLNNEIGDEKEIEKLLRNTIYNKIVKGQYPYNHKKLSEIPEFFSEYPQLFLNLDSLTNISKKERARLENDFYEGNLKFEDIRKYKELVNVLKDKNLCFAFHLMEGKSKRFDNYAKETYSIPELLSKFGNERFLELCSKYGEYLIKIGAELDTKLRFNGDLDSVNNRLKDTVSFDEISKTIENLIVRECISGTIFYNSENAPVFLKEQYPELFLSDDAPYLLKYNFYNGTDLCWFLYQLKNHKGWLPYLEGKAVSTAFTKRDYSHRADSKLFFELFGDSNAIKLGMNQPETVLEMAKTHKIPLMKSWYDKTGQKFIPDIVIMESFPLEDADKFLASGAKWSTLMKIKTFAKTKESRDAMLKLAYSFGAFDGDQAGSKKLITLLTDLPRTINLEQAYIIDELDDEISSPNQEKTLNSLVAALKRENVDIDFSKNIFSQIYRKNEDGSCTLTINPQSCPKSCRIIRSVFEDCIEFFREEFEEIPLLTPQKAHQFFGGFELKYDPDFREFLLENMELIFETPEYRSYISGIQKQFNEIKTFNSNRTLTLELAVSYLHSNEFLSVEVGNEEVAEISAIAGYTQNDFNILQQIYNYGKQRTFSSIPRIEGDTDKYTYEILRLDDPLALAIGTLTNCCQELGDVAEGCMEHSMIDKNGRIFVIRDKEGNIVSQSWVWRNKDTLCFDNIEIPDKAFKRAERDNKKLGRKEFADEVYDIYKNAAHELMCADETVYKELLESGKITKEEYDGSRLGKVTVGLGFNDIATSIKRHASVDKEKITRPLPFQAPVELTKGLYTSDSITQYVLEKREDRKTYDSPTFTVHNDTYTEYTDDNFTEKLLLSLEKLELITKGISNNMSTQINHNDDQSHRVTNLAYNYGLNPETTRVVLNSNFAIIYDVNDNKLRIADLFYNTKVQNEFQQMDIEDAVVMQIGLALKQIGEGKEIDASSLEDGQEDIYRKAINLSDEYDIERGVHHVR